MLTEENASQRRMNPAREARLLFWHYSLLSQKPHIDVHIADHCNLRCRGCMHYAPVARPRLLDLAAYEEDLILLSALPGADGYFRSIDLMGGEPLLHPKVGQAALMTRRYFPKTHISVVTNGLLLKSMDNIFFDAMHEADAELLISCYDIPVDYESLLELAEEKGVKASLSVNVARQAENGARTEDRGQFWKLVLDENGRQDPTHSWLVCPVADFLQLRDGRIYPCNHGTYLEHLNNAFGTDFRHEEGDYLDLKELTDLEALDEFRRKPRPMCRYCNMDAFSLVPWARSDFKKDEWVEP